VIVSPLASAETQYPAADFKPEIIKQDADLIAKHAEANKTTASSSSAETARASAAPSGKTESVSNAAEPSAKSEPVAAATKSEESSNLPLILVGAIGAAAAFWFMHKSKSSGAPEGASVAPAAQPAVSAAPGATGVARYISGTLGEASVPANETGVARYIRSMPPSAPAAPETGVAKYLKTVVVAEAATSSPVSKAPTGVAKYISTLPEPKKDPGETGVAKYLKSQGLAAA
jgi:hypothetical protein